MKEQIYCAKCAVALGHHENANHVFEYPASPTPQEGKKCDNHTTKIGDSQCIDCGMYAFPEEPQEKTDDYGHLIGEDRKLVFDPKCRNCDAPKSSSDWKEKEREAWKKALPLTKGITTIDTVADWWISRIETLIQQEIARVDNSGRKLWQIGRKFGNDEATTRLIALAEGIKTIPDTPCPRCGKKLNFGASQQGGEIWGCYDKKCPAVQEHNYFHSFVTKEMKTHNKALSDFITKAQHE